MKVYVVEQCYPYEGCKILHVFSSLELAEAYCDAKDAEYGYTGSVVDSPFGVTEWDVVDTASDIEVQP